MDFISWLVVGALLMLAEFGVGKFYLLGLGLACIYPAYGAYSGTGFLIQLTAFCTGAGVHTLIVMQLRRFRTHSPESDTPTDVGQLVEVIEWIDDGSARVMYRGREWMADKAVGEMPDADHGTIQSVQYGRLVIVTKPAPVKPA